MTKKIILALVLTVVIIEVLRETGYLDLQLYNSNIHEESNTNFSNTVTTSDIDDPTESAAPGRTRFDEVPIIIIEGRDTLYQQEGKGMPMDIRIETPDPAALWVSFYKRSHFDFDLHIDHYDTIGNEVDASRLSMNGTMQMDGHITIKGLCSRRKAREILRNKIVEVVADKVEEYLKGIGPVY